METYHVKVSAPGFQGVCALVTVQSYNAAGACASAERIVRSQLTSFVESPTETKLREADERMRQINDELDSIEEKWSDSGWAIEAFGEQAQQQDSARADVLRSQRSQIWAVIHELESTTP